MPKCSCRQCRDVVDAEHHVFVRGVVEVLSARYVAEGIAGVGPVDHAALVVEVVQGS